MKVAGTTMDLMQNSGTKYLNIPEQLVKKEKLAFMVDRLDLRLHTQNYNQLGE